MKTPHYRRAGVRLKVWAQGCLNGESVTVIDVGFSALKPSFAAGGIYKAWCIGKRDMQIPLFLRPGIRHVLRGLTGPGTLRSTARSWDILCPEEKAELEPAIFLPGQIEKVTGAPSESTVAAEIRAMTEREVIHAPAIAYHIKDAALFGGSVYAGNMRYFIFDGHQRKKVRSTHIEKAALTSTFVGIKYFGHWLKDDCTLRLLCEEFGDLLCVRANPHRDCTTYGDYFQQEWSTETNGALIDHLVIMQDFGQNSSKRRRYELLRSRLKARLGSQKAKPLVYLKRGATGASRMVHNEEEIIIALREKGFEILDIATVNLEYMLTVLSQADVVVSVEGSHCAHCAFSLPVGSGLILLQPPDRFCANQRGWAESLSIRSGFVVGDAVGGSSCSFSVSAVLQTVDLMLQQISAAC
jgi:Glycosyltransferase 61